MPSLAPLLEELLEGHRADSRSGSVSTDVPGVHLLGATRCSHGHLQASLRTLPSAGCAGAICTPYHGVITPISVTLRCAKAQQA